MPYAFQCAPMPWQVRCHALGTLARLLETLGTDTSSFGEALQMVLAASADSSSDVTQCLLQTTLPAMLRWVGESELLVSQLLPQASKQATIVLSW